MGSSNAPAPETEEVESLEERCERLKLERDRALDGLQLAAVMASILLEHHGGADLVDELVADILKRRNERPAEQVQPPCVDCGERAILVTCPPNHEPGLRLCGDCYERREA